jgi:cell division protein FtsL
MTMMMISVVVLMVAISLAPFRTAVYTIQQDTPAQPLP